MRRILFPALALILALGLALVLTAAPALTASASVWTDKQDYAPEEVVTISGSDFLANAEVAVTVERPDGVTDTVTPAPVTDDTGYFICTYQLDGIAGTYTVTATDGTNTAVTTFTDKVVSISITVSPTTVAPSSTTSFTVTVSIPTPDTVYHSVDSVEISMAAISGSNWGTPGSVSISGFDDAGSWTVNTASAGLLKIQASSDATALQPGETMTVTFSLQAPSANGTSTWTVTGYNTPTFSGSSDTKEETIETAEDTTPPTVTINQASGQADPTNTSPIDFTVVFSEPVADFATGDVTLGGTAGATTGTVTGSGTTYNVAVSGMTSDGTVTASIAAGVAHDAAGNANTASSSTDNVVTYDTTPPTVTITAPAPGVYTTPQTLTYTVTDNLDPSPVVAGPASGTVYTDGVYSITITATDWAGNVGSASVNFTIILDTAPPTGYIVINGGALYTNSTSVTLHLSATDAAGVTGYRVADGIDASGASTIAVSSTTSFHDDIPWTLPSGDGTKWVAVQYRDAVGNWSPNYMDSIILDTTPPVVNITAPDDGGYYTTATLPGLAYTVVEANPYTVEVTGWSTDEGVHTVVVTATDAAGNEGSDSVTYTVDNTAPTGSITINGGAPYTNSTSVTLNLAATDAVGVTGYRVADGTHASGGTTVTVPSTTSFSADIPWTLPSGDGTKWVAVQYRDAAGNWSPNYVDSIILDTTPPTGSITINGGAPYTNSTSVTLNLTATDAEGVTGYRVADGTDASGASTIAVSSTTSFSADIPWTLPPGDGTKTVAVQYRDAAGNWSPNYTDSIILDTTPPSDSITINGGATYTNSTSVTLNITATDAEGITGYRVADGSDASGGSTVPVSSTTSFNADIPWTLPSGDGTKTVAVQYRDAVGNWSPNYTDSIILDTTLPVVNITAPDDGGYYTTATLPELAYTVVEANPYTVEVTGWSTDEGVHTVAVTATDAAGNQGSDSVTYTVDNTPPVVTINAPTNDGDYRTDTPPALDYTVSDNLDPSPGVVVSGWSTDKGVHTVTVTATDAAGNVGSASVTYNVLTVMNWALIGGIIAAALAAGFIFWFFAMRRRRRRRSSE